MHPHLIQFEDHKLCQIVFWCWLQVSQRDPPNHHEIESNLRLLQVLQRWKQFWSWIVFNQQIHHSRKKAPRRVLRSLYQLISPQDRQKSQSHHPVSSSLYPWPLCQKCGSSDGESGLVVHLPKDEPKSSGLNSEGVQKTSSCDVPCVLSNYTHKKPPYGGWSDHFTNCQWRSEMFQMLNRPMGAGSMPDRTRSR